MIAKVKRKTTWWGSELIRICGQSRALLTIMLFCSRPSSQLHYGTNSGLASLYRTHPLGPFPASCLQACQPYRDPFGAQLASMFAMPGSSS